jgi:hypothetical protein
MAAACATFIQEAEAATRTATVAQPNDSLPTLTTDGTVTGQYQTDGASQTRYQCARRASAVETIQGCDQIRHKHGSGIWPILIGIAVLGVLAYLLSRTRFPSKTPSAQQLLDEGPQSPTSVPDGTFGVQGFASDGWPILVDFQPQPGTVTQLDVTVGSGHHKV